MSIGKVITFNWMTHLKKHSTVKATGKHGVKFFSKICNTLGLHFCHAVKEPKQTDFSASLKMHLFEAQMKSQHDKVQQNTSNAGQRKPSREYDWLLVRNHDSNHHMITSRKQHGSRHPTADTTWMRIRLHWLKWYPDVFGSKYWKFRARKALSGFVYPSLVQKP